ncbi:hypothetical protein ACFC26_16305 [Kitasatospora purpeofusca]|uniref:hypothetical protein n=1 Tax=Kitasatospora purpeofusca TaxID=67352 RepID=UPI0035DC366E
MRRTALALAAAGLTLTATACSSGTDKTPAAAAPTTPAAAAPASTSAAASAPAAPPSSAPATTKSASAEAITKGLTAKGLPVKLTVTYDATTDPNGKMGRPGQYISKVAFDDTRVSGTEQAKTDEVQGRRDSISYGGTIETFASEEDAKTWATYVITVSKAVGGLVTPDYVYQRGTTVARVSHLLTPDQAKAYEAAIG